MTFFERNRVIRTLERMPWLRVWFIRANVQVTHKGCPYSRTMRLKFDWKGRDEYTDLYLCLDCNLVGTMWDLDWPEPGTVYKGANVSPEVKKILIREKKLMAVRGWMKGDKVRCRNCTEIHEVSINGDGPWGASVDCPATNTHSMLGPLEDSSYKERMLER